MPWEMNGETVALDGGNPVWRYEDGKTAPVEFDKALGRISDLNKNEKTLRETLEATNGKLKTFDIFQGEDGKPLDPGEVKKALETVKGLSERKLIEAGEANKIRDDAVAGFKVKLGEHEQTIQGLNKTLEEKEKGWAFAQSKFLADKMFLPPDMALKIFGDSFKVEDGKVVGYIGTERIPSRKDLGSFADFEEALEALVERHPYKDRILKTDGAGGSGAVTVKPPAPGGRHQLSRTEAKDPAKYRAAKEAAEKAGVQLQILD